MNTFRLTQGQCGRTLLALGAAMVQANPQGRSEYIRLANAISQGCAPQVGGSLELHLTPVQTDQVLLALEGARALGDTPPEFGHWMTDLQRVFQMNPQTVGASGG